MRTTLAITSITIALMAGAAAAHADTTPSVTLSLISNPGAVQPGTMVAIAAGASGFINPSYSASDSFAGSTVSSGDVDSSGYFSWTPSANDAGQHQITISATDSYGHSASGSLNVLVAAGAVFVENMSPGTTIGYGRTLTFAISAPGYISPTYIVDDSYPGSSVSGGNVASGGTFSWTPAVNQQGPHTFTIYVSDAYGHSGAIRQSVTVTSPQVSIYGVKPVNPIGVPLTISVIASGLATTTYSVTDSFLGTTTVAASDINSAGTFAWTPSASDLGLHTLTITASDPFGNTASALQQVYIVAATPGASTTTTTSPTVTATVTANAATTASSPSASMGTGYDGYVFTKVLSQGMSGAAVTELQKRLAYFEIYSGPITGYFGALTAAAVKKLQASDNLAQVGYTGPLTRAKLNTAFFGGNGY